ncbi:MAG: AraC family transcriptional regulator [Capsulimonas sp.]|uniref:helix-turn-helix transcriptional regulator n=1 Tax=Capsulimonas sp. TaxID=2494211 RepID=UPI00326570F2
MINHDGFSVGSSSILQAGVSVSIQAGDAGQLVSRGIGRHPNRIWPTFDLLYVQSGILGIQEDNTAFEVKPGESMLLWPGRHHWGTAEYTPDLIYFWLHFDLRDEEATPRSLNEVSIPQHAAIARPSHLTELFRRYLDDQESPDRDQLTADLTVCLILCEISRSTRVGASPLAPRSMLSDQAKKFVQANSHLPITTSTVARAIDVNPNYLSRIFRRDFGTTITDAIHQSRMLQARVSLMEDNETVDTIARKCGYESAIYFRRVFHRIHGMTPLEYRRLYLKAHVIGY